jgi:uncharacterized membrane protein
MNAHTHTRAAATAALLALAVAGAGPLSGFAAAAESHKRLVYATYNNETSASDVFKALRSAERDNVVSIDSYAVISKGLDGKIRVKDQRSKGTKAGAVVGALVGLLGGPVGVVVGAAAGGTVGYLTGNAVGMPKATVDQIKTSLEPGQSAIIAVVDDKWAETVQKMQEARAARITNESIPLLKDENAAP